MTTLGVGHPDGEVSENTGLNGITEQEKFLGFIQAHIPMSSKHNPDTVIVRTRL